VTRTEAPLHRQVSVTVGAVTADVDEQIAPLVRELWLAGWRTYSSCQEHPVSGAVWLAFYRASDVEAFLNAVAIHQRNSAGSLWQRANDWGFGDHTRSASHIDGFGDWEYHASVVDYAYDAPNERFHEFGRPNFGIPVSVLFPRRDLQTVIDRMRFHNQQAAEIRSP